MIGGMVVGSWLTNRLAGRLDGRVLVDWAMAGLVLAGAANVVLTGVVPTLPWAVVGPALMGTAIGIVFPVLQLAMLDLFPHHRGSAASMASFASLVFNAALAGVVTPLVSTSLSTLAATSLGLAVLGAVLWVRHRRTDAPG